MPNLNTLLAFLEQGSVLVLTGAGISAASGIPTYRDDQGNWKRSDPIKHQDFIAKLEKRQRYWARSLVGWKPVDKARPNLAHVSLAKLQKAGFIQRIVTQNVDGLHNLAGATDVIDLHGRLDQVICLDCGDISRREDLQPRLVNANPDLQNYIAEILPDGDADIDDYPMETVVVPSCTKCHGALKPHVVFFGDNVPKSRTEQAINSLKDSAKLLTVGSSLQVYSGFRFCRIATEEQIPIGCVNKGVTRADHLFVHKWENDCADLLNRAAAQLCG